MDQFDWNQLRGFLATAEAGSLSAAARKLGLTQPTLSRQVAALEASLGVTLFERVGKTLMLTATGVELLDHAKAMGGAADALSLAATGRSQDAEGIVSISASDGMAAFILPRIVKRIVLEAPRIAIEVVASNALSDLRRREADIAIRHVRPDQPDLIGKLIREATAGFYASEEWVAKNGRPMTAKEAQTARFVGYDRTGQFANHLRGLGLSVGADQFPVMTDNSVANWELVRQGLGIGVMMDDIAAVTSGVVRVLEDVVPVTFPVWLVTHRELHTSRRIRVVFDMLAEELGKRP
jgi:DNA-binding transcriptional LysR family regulator